MTSNVTGRALENPGWMDLLAPVGPDAAEWSGFMVPPVSGLRFANGGQIPGYGGGDILPALLEPGEFVVNKGATAKYAPVLHAMNQGGIAAFSEGGLAPDVSAAQSVDGMQYSKTGSPRTDCSGAVSLVIDGALGLPMDSQMSTRDAEPWLDARGFVPGEGGKGEMTVYWYNKGSGENDGHMAMRLSDGQMFESGPDNKITMGANTDTSKFTYAMHRPATAGVGEGDSSGSSGMPSSSGFNSSSGGRAGARCRLLWPAAAGRSGAGGSSGGPGGGTQGQGSLARSRGSSRC